MIRQRCLGLVLALLGLLWLPQAARTAGEQPGTELFLQDVSGTYLCPRDVVRREPKRCPPYGPGARAVRWAYLRAQLPQPLPELPLEPLPAPESRVTRYTYGRIVDLPAPTYRHPAEGDAGLPPVRVFQSNINWASIAGRVEYNGQVWYQINANEYIAARHVDFPEASRFQGVALAEQPAYPFGWLRRELIPSPAPGASPQTGGVLSRRALVTVFAMEEINGQRWDLIGPDQWVRHDYVSLVTPKPAPPGVPAGVKWIEVDTYEQTLAAYVGDRLVYATLTTTGRPVDLTPLGLFRIFRKVSAALMQSIDRPMDDRYWFHLEDVEHAQFFNDRISLHAAYWHDAFGTVRSNGCVNLTPLDARWLYEWADPQLGPSGSWITSEAAGEGQTWVWVHHSAPDLRAKPAP